MAIHSFVSEDYCILIVTHRCVDIIERKNRVSHKERESVGRARVPAAMTAKMAGAAALNSVSSDDAFEMSEDRYETTAGEESWETKQGKKKNRNDSKRKHETPDEKNEKKARSSEADKQLHMKQHEQQAELLHRKQHGELYGAQHDNSKTVFVKGNYCNMGKLAYSNPVKFQKEIIKEFGKVDRIKIKGQYVIIVCNSLQQKEALLHETNIMGKPVEVTAAFESKKSKENQTSEQHEKAPLFKGIIFGVPVELSDEEIKEATEAESVKRMTKRIGEEIHLTTNVVLGFLEEISDSVNIGFIRFRMKPYITRPYRCTNCQRFGHNHKDCYRPAACARCSGPHSTNECPTTSNAENAYVNTCCANCKKDHSAAWTGCQVYQQVQETLRISRLEHVDYKTAHKEVIKREEEEEETESNEQEEQSEEGRQIKNTRYKKPQQKPAHKAIKIPAAKAVEKIEHQHSEKHTDTASSQPHETKRLDELIEINKKLTDLLKFCVFGIITTLERTTDTELAATDKNFSMTLYQYAAKCGVNISDLWKPEEEI